MCPSDRNLDISLEDLLVAIGLVERPDDGLDDWRDETKDRWID